MTIWFAPLELGSNLVFADKKVQRYRTYFFLVLLNLHCELYANNGAVRALLCKLNFDWLIIEIASQMAWNSPFLVSRILEIDPKQYDWCTIGIPLRLSMQQWSGREGITLNCIEWSFVFLFSRIYFLHYSLTHSHSSGFNVLLMRGWGENSLQTPRQGARRDDQSDVRCCYLRIWLWLSRWGTSSTFIVVYTPDDNDDDGNKTSAREGKSGAMWCQFS